LRLSLPLPTAKQLSDFISKFLNRFGENQGHSSASIAKALGTISYAEAEEFCLDIRRRQVLSAGEKPLKAIVAQQLSLWTSKARARRTPLKGEGNARAAATSPSKS
jgi:hypothetical protein